MMQQKVAFIGAGNMATAIISGIVKSDYPAHLITASHPNQAQLETLQSRYGIQVTQDNTEAAQQADVVILCVKPQMMAQVCEEMAVVSWSDKLVISIAAGINCHRLSTLLKTSELALVRVMPNTPALINCGMTGMYATPAVSETSQQLASQLFQAIGEVCWVAQESGINQVIAAAGSAPAYFFLFMEAMHAEAVAMGFDTDTARKLIQQTALGAAEMVIANPETPIGLLREQVTSKGGTTAEALRIFNQHRLSDIVSKAMQAAVIRAEEMEQQL